LKYLRIYLPNGVVWEQTGVGYPSVEAVKAVWDKVAPYLPDGVEGTVFSKEAVDISNGKSIS